MTTWGHLLEPFGPLLFIVSSEFWTHVVSCTQAFSWIDFSLCLSTIYIALSWKALNDLQNSEHFPIIITLICFPPSSLVPSVMVWLELIQIGIFFTVYAPLSNLLLSLESSYFFNDILLDAALSIPRGAPLAPGSAFPGGIRTALMLYVCSLEKDTDRLLNLLFCFRKQVFCYGFIHTAKCESWRSYVSIITVDIPLHQIWKKSVRLLVNWFQTYCLSFVAMVLLWPLLESCPLIFCICLHLPYKDLF